MTPWGTTTLVQFHVRSTVNLMSIQPEQLSADLYKNSITLPSQQHRVVDLIRIDGIHSRTDLAQRLGASRASVTGIVRELFERGILEETTEAESTGGRRAKMLDFSADFGCVIGIDMGATSVDIALADFRGTFLARQHAPIDVNDGPDVVLAQVQEIALMLAQEHGVAPDEVLSIGIGVPGPVDFMKGVLVSPPIMPGWEKHPIRERMRESFPRATVVVDNDVNVMALGELRSGAGKDSSNFLFVKVGTGIGCGIVAHGEIYRGTDGSAGDIGHIQADRDGPVCHCGNVGCIEAMASGKAIARQALALARDGSSPILAQYLTEGAPELTAKHVGQAAHQGDKAAMELIKFSGSLIGQVLAGTVNFFNPSMILIGGGVSKIGTQFLATIRRGVLSRSLPLSTQHLRIDYSPMGDDAGVTGAVTLALEHIFIAKP